MNFCRISVEGSNAPIRDVQRGAILIAYHWLLTRHAGMLALSLNFAMISLERLNSC